MDVIMTANDGRKIVTINPEEAAELQTAYEAAGEALSALTRALSPLTLTEPASLVGNKAPDPAAIDPPVVATPAAPVTRNPSRKRSAGKKTAAKKQARYKRSVPPLKGMHEKVLAILKASKTPMATNDVVKKLSAGENLEQNPVWNSRVGACLQGMKQRGTVIAATPGNWTWKRPELTENDLSSTQREMIDADPKALTTEGRQRRLELLRKLGR